MPVTTPRKPSLSIASETAQVSNWFNRATTSSILLSLPIHERHRIAGAGFGAIARDVIDFVEPLAFGGHCRNDGQPILDLGRADAEIVFRQSGKRVFIAAFHRAENALVKFLIDHEVSQATRSDECNSLVAGPILDCAAQGVAKREAAADRGTVRLEMHIEDNRHRSEERRVGKRGKARE